MISLKFKTWGFKDNLARYLLIIGAAVIVAVMRLPGMLWVIVFYALVSLAFGRRQSSSTR